MNFVGTGRKLTPVDLAEAARVLKCNVPRVQALIEVEAASYGFDAKRRPRILFEPHIFWRELGAGPVRDQAVAAGLAYRTAGTRPYPQTMDARYAQLDRAIALNASAALKSASWGLGQVMGFNFRPAGYATVEAFVESMKRGESQQLMAMVAFIIANGLDAPLREGRWTDFAVGYNGPKQRGYDRKLEAAYRQFSIGSTTSLSDPTIGKNSTSHFATMELQRLLNLRGNYGLVVDGEFGDRTLEAVHHFQTEHGLLVDGIVGKATWAALRDESGGITPAPGSDARNDEDPAPAPPPPDGGLTQEQRDDLASRSGCLGQFAKRKP